MVRRRQIYALLLFCEDLEIAAERHAFLVMSGGRTEPPVKWRDEPAGTFLFIFFRYSECQA
jgi:hypothetical protein